MSSYIYKSVYPRLILTNSSILYICFREEEGRKRVRLLQRQLQDVKKEKEKELQERNEMIAHYKDQLQEMKAKTNMEGKLFNSTILFGYIL